MPIKIALYEPEIPPNTGNIIRLCANSGAELHLIHPLGFDMDTKALRRAGLDYCEWATIKEHENFDAFLSNENPARIFACTTKTKQSHTTPHYQDNDVLLFGPESRGLPNTIRDRIDPAHQIRIPMLPTSRSLNLSNSVAIILYEALRQGQFKNLT